jgi:hypothetical protein
MGVLSDVFIAFHGELTEDVFASGPMGRLTSVEGKGLFPDSIAKLWKIFDPAGFEPFGPEWIIENPTGDDEHTIYQIPTPLVAGIARASDERIREVEVAWVYDGTPPQNHPLDGLVPDWFEEFVDLLKQAHAQNRNAYVWMSP